MLPVVSANELAGIAAVPSARAESEIRAVFFMARFSLRKGVTGRHAFCTNRATRKERYDSKTYGDLLREPHCRVNRIGASGAPQWGARDGRGGWSGTAPRERRLPVASACYRD